MADYKHRTKRFPDHKYSWRQSAMAREYVEDMDPKERQALGFNGGETGSLFDRRKGDD